MKTRNAVENLLTHYRSGECQSHHPECRNEVITVLEWVLSEPAAAAMEQTNLFRLATAVLLFYQVGPWTDAEAATWLSLTGSHEATTVVLCDLARRLLAGEN